MRQRLVSIGDDFWIETDDGQRAYKVNGKALRLRKTLIFEDPDGRELAKIQERVARVRDSMEIEDADGNRIATVKKALISPLRDRWAVTIGDGPDLDIQGNILDHEYTFTDGRTTVATVSKKWFRVADTYGVEIAPGPGSGGHIGGHGRGRRDGPRRKVTVTATIPRISACSFKKVEELSAPRVKVAPVSRPAWELTRERTAGSGPRRHGSRPDDPRPWYRPSRPSRGCTGTGRDAAQPPPGGIRGERGGG